MDTPALHLLDSILGDEFSLSWHKDERRSLGVPDDCNDESLLCLTLKRKGVLFQPMAFIIDDHQRKNVVKAMGDFLTQAFHPLYKREEAIGLIDYLPPIDDYGMAIGAARRWIIDKNNYQQILPHVQWYMDTLFFNAEEQSHS